MNTLIKNGQKHKLESANPTHKKINRYKTGGGTHHPEWNKALLTRRLRTESYNQYVKGCANTMTVLLYRSNN